MSHIRAKDTKPELLVRQRLWADGYRYRLCVKTLPGKPDIVLRKYKIAIFVNGCFWHGHHSAYTFGHPESLESSACCKIPKTRTEFWTQKISRNIERDIMNYRCLQDAGWKVLVVWECQLKGKERQKQTLQALSCKMASLVLETYKSVSKP